VAVISRQWRPVLVLITALAAAGAALGVLWQWWAPARPLALVLGPHLIEPDETESFIGGDARYAVIVGSVGLAAGLLTWWWGGVRGPATALVLGVGCFVGGALTALVGNRLGGGTSTGATNTLINHLPLTVHMHALWLLEPMLALGAYSVCAAFAVHDDLGVGDGEEPSPLAMVGISAPDAP
jgi:hypothetical protein